MKSITFFTLCFIFLFITSIHADIINVPADTSTIQGGISLATPGDTVLVGENTYYENIDFKGKSITVASHFLLDQDTSHISKTIIDGSKPSNPDSASVVYFISGEDSNSVLMGFTITGGTGNHNISVNFEDRSGGGIFISFAGAKILHNRIIDNHINTFSPSQSWAGGIAAWCDKGDFIIIENNYIANNSVTSTKHSFGAGMAIGTGEKIRCINNRIENNRTIANRISCGGGVYMFGGDQTPWGWPVLNGQIIFSNNLVNNNHINHGGSTDVISGGAGIHIDMISPLMENNIISDNTAEKYGGGIMVQYNTRGGLTGKAEPVMINNTITNNSAQLGSGIHAYQSKIVLVNNIVWGNPSSASTYDIYKTNTNRLYFANNNIYGWPLNFGYDHGGNIDQNPLFKFPVHGEYELDKYSPCTGSGTESVQINSVTYIAPGIDFNGNNRPNAIDNLVDMGAFESKYKADMDELVLYLSFDDSTAQDASIYENKVEVSGESKYTAGFNGKNAFYFDGTNFIKIHDSEVLDTDTSFTISLWIRPDSVTSQGAKFMSKWYSSPQQGDWMFSLSSRDSVNEGSPCVQWAGYAANYGEFGYTGIGIPRDSLHRYLLLKQWNHIATTFDRGYICSYVNGFFVDDSMSQILYTSLGEYDSDDIFIGRFWRSWPGYEFIGSIDEVQIYDRALSKEEIYDWVTDIDKVDFSDKIPDQFILHQNYPNPFNPITTINYELPARSAGGPITNYVDLSIYNLLGQKVATLVSKRQTTGSYQVEWDASGFATGVYIYRLSTKDGFVQSKKLLLLK